MRHAKLLFYEDERECDICDCKRPCAIIEDLIGNCSCYCLQCLQDIITEYYEEVDD